MQKVDGVGQAVIFRGDPRRAGEKSDMESWLTSLLEKGRKEDSEIRSRPHLYGSDAGFCSRRNVLLQHNVWLNSTVNSAGRGYMAIGIAFEDLLVESLKRAGRFLTGQLRGANLPGLKVSSRFDAVILDANDDLALLEVKTCGRLPDEEKPAHLAQLQTYAAQSGIRNAHLVYMSRELSPLRSIPVRSFAVDTSDEALLKRMAIAYESGLAAEKAALPPRPATFRKHTECHYCEFRDYFCWNARPGRGGDEAQPPLPELTPAEYIILSDRAKASAQDALRDIDSRRLATLREIAKEGGLTSRQRVAVAKLVREAEAVASGGGG